MSLSDQFCVDRHKPHFLNLVQNKLDITFANEQEITSLIEAKNFDDVINFSNQLKKLVVITRGDKGAVAIYGEEVIESGIQKNLKIVDHTGAGDLFSAGFLHRYVNKLVVVTRGEKGAVAINGEEVFESGVQKNLKIVDLTGAGDLFAAGFLHGYVNKLLIKECLEKGTEMSSRVIQQIGARL